MALAPRGAGPASIRLVAWRQIGFHVGRVAGLDLAATFQLGIELGAQPDHHVREPQPDQERDTPPSAP
jgi:hypothetical protein